MKSKGGIFKRIFFTVLLLCIGAVSATTVYGYYQLSRIKIVEISKSNEELGIKPEVITKVEVQRQEKGKEIINIALFGVDKRVEKDIPRSDSIMIVSIDQVHRKIKLMSIMRDTYVEVKGYGKTKLNHAYAIGGPQLAIRTINENFDLDVRNYATVDFYNMEKIVDALGGITVDVKKDEIKNMNYYIAEIARIEKVKTTPVKRAGVQKLNGKQAVAYSRIRNTGAGDFERVDRQRTVLNAVFQKIQNSGKAEFASTVFRLLPFIETSMNREEILNRGMDIFSEGITQLDQERFPVDGYCIGKVIKGTWYLTADMKSTKKHINEYIYEDIKPKHKAPLF